jgi:hypothetical protein
VEEHLDLSVFEARYWVLSKIGNWSVNQDTANCRTLGVGSGHSG